MACVAFGCKSHSSKKDAGDENVTFHRFPQDEKIKEFWIMAISRNHWAPTKFSRLCSKHFEPKCYIEGKLRRILRRDAIPSIFENNPTYLSMQATKSARSNVIDNERRIRAIRRKMTAAASNSEPSTSKQSQSFVTDPEASTSLYLPHINDTPRKKKLRQALLKEKINSTSRLNRLKNAQQKCRRLRKKIETLETIMCELKTKSLVNDEMVQILKDIGVENQDFLCRYINKKKGISLPREYSPELRKFAVTLQYLSPRAYNYIRNQFNTILPHPSTISKWYKSVDCSPGFTTESLDTIQKKMKDGKKIYCALSIDGMAIRKLIEWDGSKYYGYVDIGNGLSSDNLPAAKEALVFMLTSLNENWKIPVGYFFIDGITGVQLSSLVKQCMNLLINCNITLAFITFDGLPSNLAMAADLGCILSLENFKTTFNYMGCEVGIFLDPCHCIKLVRNTLAESNGILDENGHIITWEHIKALANCQAQEGFHAANKLKNEHILYEKQKMKVRLATQVLSASVADSLDFCRESKIAGFEHTEATSKFIRLFNDLFDILNSRNLKAKGWKKPIATFNCKDIWTFFDKAESYIKKLKFVDSNSFVVSSKRKTGFLGLIVCMKSIRHIFEAHVSPSSDLKFLSTYKISQDHVELFFSAIRAKGGHNNNPSARQFISAYKRLLVHAQFKSDGRGNCIPLGEINILTTSSRDYVDRINFSTNRFKMFDNQYQSEITESVEFREHDYFFDPSRLTEFAEEIVKYIAGYVVRKIKKKIICCECIGSLEKYDLGVLSSFIIFRDPSNKLTNIKNKGGLIYASPDVIKVCNNAEKIMKKYIFHYGPKQIGLPKNLLTLISETFERSSDLFPNLIEHSFQQWNIDNHRNLLIKAIAESYLTIRIHYLTKKIEEPSDKIRSFFNKCVLFKGQ